MAKRLLATLSDTSLFLQEWLANPQHTGAIAPSSPRLAAAMARWLPEDRSSYVVELGPGTGAVTTGLLRAGLRENRLVAIEKNPRMAACLHQRFRRANIITGDAWDLDTLLEDFLPANARIGAVFSSLPLLNFPKKEATALAAKIHDVLEPSGTWVQYSYHLTREILPGAERFRSMDFKLIWLNLPPARVSAYHK